MRSAPANDDKRPAAAEPARGGQPPGPRWSGRMTIGVLTGFSILLWALISGGVYLAVRILL
jgi:hypothetical protein